MLIFPTVKLAVFAIGRITGRPTLKQFRNFSWKTQHDSTCTFGALIFAKCQYALHLLISQAGVIGAAMMRKGLPGLFSQLIIIRRRLGTGARGSNLWAKAAFRVVTRIRTVVSPSSAQSEEEINCPLHQ